MRRALCILLSTTAAACEPSMWTEAARTPLPTRSWYAMTSDERAFDATVTAGAIDVREQAQSIAIFESDADRPTEIIGMIAVRQPMAAHAEALDELRASAVRVGADAVVHVELHRDDRASDPTVTLSGVAVRYGDILAGRGYVVLGEIEIEGAADEADVVSALRRRARELGADAIVGVHLQRGNAGGPLRALGTAIRFGG